jgi:PAS domain S-box-containing protein
MATPARTFYSEVEVLKAILNDLAVGVAACDRNGTLAFFNPEAERILGIGLKQAEAGRWSSIYGCYLPDMATRYPPGQLPLARAARGEEVAQELIFVRNERQASGIWISAGSRPIRDATGALCGAVMVFREVTEAHNILCQSGDKIAAAAVTQRPAGTAQCEACIERLLGFRDYHTRLSRAVEQTADSVVITDVRGVIEYVNPAFEQTTGYRASEALGKTPRILKSGRQDAEFYRALWKQLLAGKPFRDVIINRRKSGELYWAQQTITPIKNEKKQITHFVSVLTDVTELRKRQEEEFHHQLAHEVQQRFYSARIRLPGFDIAGAAYPVALTGGDYFDFIEQPDGCAYLAIGDVSGHGFGAALQMATTRAYIRAYAQCESNVGAILSRGNKALTADLDGPQFMTLLLIRLDPGNRTLEYASAGHSPGYVLSAKGDVRHVLEATGPPAGSSAIPNFRRLPSDHSRTGTPWC